MSESNQDPSIESASDIRIVGVNREKTRKTSEPVVQAGSGGPGVRYHVYFELSETPPQAWGRIFEEEWKLLNPGEPQLWQAANVDRIFLVLRCPLKEVATKHLPVLHKAVAATNKTYKQSIQQQATEQELREDVWKQERKTVDDMADSLNFEALPPK